MTFFRLLFHSISCLCLISGTLTAARPFPPTVYDSLRHRSVIVFMDQLHSRLSPQEALVRFVEIHYGPELAERLSMDLQQRSQ